MPDMVFDMASIQRFGNMVDGDARIEQRTEILVRRLFHSAIPPGKMVAWGIYPGRCHYTLLLNSTRFVKNPAKWKSPSVKQIKKCGNGVRKIFPMTETPAGQTIPEVKCRFFWKPDRFIWSPIPRNKNNNIFCLFLSVLYAGQAICHVKYYTNIL